MPRYRVIYGGSTWVEAASEHEAYASSWAWLCGKIDQGECGLIVEVEAVSDDPYRLDHRGSHVPARVHQMERLAPWETDT